MAPKKAAAKMGSKAKATPASPAPEPNPAATALLASPPTEFSAIRLNFQKGSQKLVETLKKRRFDEGVTEPLEEEEAVRLVEEVMDLVGKSPVEPKKDETNRETELVVQEVDKVELSRSDFRRAAVDRGCEEMLMDAAMLPTADDGSSDAAYGLLCDLLETILTFSEKGYCDIVTPMNCVQSLLELQTIAGCQHIFSWIELRSQRLTKDMSPLRGKGPVLLRILNELLRRLPKSKTEHVIFSGRILMFLSSVFPLGEKSGVNLRGNFNLSKGTVWEGKDAAKEEKKDEEVEMKDGEVLVIDDGEEKAKMEVEEEAVEDGEEKESKNIADDFYPTFWSLQTYFINPPTLFDAHAPEGFETLQKNARTTLDVFSGATKKEKEVSGSGKEKVKEVEDMEMEHYFFPKFLTSPDLLELEIADPQFRRQILVQIAVLFHFLLGHTKEARERADKLPIKNTAAVSAFTLSPEHEKWILELLARVLEEMSAMEGGPDFRATVELILKRDQNWINWKLKQCYPFEQKPLDHQESERAQKALLSITRKPVAFKNKMGNYVLTDLWKRNTTTLENFHPKPTDKDFDTLTREWVMNQRKVDAKKKQMTTLEQQAASTTGAEQIARIRNEIEEMELVADSLSWRAWRAAGNIHFKVYDKSGTGTIPELLEAIEKGREAEEKAKRETDGTVTLAELKVEPEAPDEVASPDVKMTEVVEPVVDIELVEEKGEDTASTASPKRPRTDDDVEMEGSESKKIKMETDT